MMVLIPNGENESRALILLSKVMQLISEELGFYYQTVIVRFFHCDD
jgi:hypothetical protein